MTEASDGDGRVAGLPKEYFFVSDLHIGGDEQLKILDFEDEFIEFLKMLEQREADTELIIGDAFGLWVHKAAPRELSLLQRLVSRKPQRDVLETIPQRTVIG